MNLVRIPIQELDKVWSMIEKDIKLLAKAHNDLVKRVKKLEKILEHQDETQTVKENKDEKELNFCNKDNGKCTPERKCPYSDNKDIICDH